MLLIADSGATKVDWRALTDKGEVKEIATEGINPVFLSKERIVEILKNELLPIIGPNVRQVFFYGAGVVSPEIIGGLQTCFKEVFPKSNCTAESDMLAAARALCGHKAGIASILGTGSNSCFYDGMGIVKNVRAGGFILGDEASGAYLGKRFLSDFIKGLLPKEIEEEFVKRFDLDYIKIVQKVYREPVPSKFLASFSPFIFEYREDPHVRRMLLSSFDEFLSRNIVHYDYMNYPLNFVGSVAFHYRDILEESIRRKGMKLGKILKSPISGLVDYHQGVI